jgi:hypothetical protein
LPSAAQLRDHWALTQGHGHVASAKTKPERYPRAWHPLHTASCINWQWGFDSIFIRKPRPARGGTNRPHFEKWRLFEGKS